MGAVPLEISMAENGCGKPWSLSSLSQSNPKELRFQSGKAS